MRGQSGKASSASRDQVRDEPKGVPETPLGTVYPVI